MRRTLRFGIPSLLPTTPFALAERPEAWKSWNNSVEPFRIAVSLHDVGTKPIVS